MDTINADEQYYMQLIDKEGFEVVSGTFAGHPCWPETVVYKGKVYAYAWSIAGKGWCYQSTTSVQWDDLSKK